MNIRVLAFFLLVALAFSTASYAGSKSKEEGIVEWPQVPHKAQQIITEHIQGGEILKIKKEHIILMKDKGMKKKTIIYLARIQNTDGKKIWVTVDKDGELVDVEDEDTDPVLEDLEDEKNQKNKKGH
ncbi:hypothetical protein C8R34_1276 [Nitrosomonas sp. Nm84]|uniref:hypothetical protein n=1 Tax=Nitrosomonas sp. Nm84 TaxID=200124 RepID=UPI000D7659F0|nr:hypothetical protein [Nitrosomonas sp. Nm84]PXW83484.1 hypothetical protein C8R34_1276 [Nitrosomonas sp. Nm84]